MTNPIIDTIVMGAFGGNYVLGIIIILLAISIILFWYRWSGPEVIIASIILTFGLFIDQINPLFTTLFALVMLVSVVLIISFIWRQIANG